MTHEERLAEITKARQDLAELKAQLPPGAEFMAPLVRLFVAIEAVAQRIRFVRSVMNMRIVAHVGGRDAVIRRAQRILAQPAPEGANVVIVGHGNLMRAATGADASEAGSGVYAPRAGSEPGFELVALLTPDDWMRLAELVGEDG
jgi:hypothetical protein